MEKKSLTGIILLFVAIFVWLFFVGQANGISNVAGDINLIDEGQFAAWTGHMLQGETIYKDISIQYGPLPIFLIYSIMKLFGASMFSVRFVSGTLMVFLGIVVALFFMKYLRVNTYIRMLTTFFILLVPGVSIRYFIGVISIVLAVEAQRKLRAFYGVLLGISLALSLLISIDVYLFSVIILSFYFIYKLIFERNILSSIKIILYSLFGFLIIMIPFLTIASVGNFLTDFIKATKEIITSVSGINLPNGQGLPTIIFPRMSVLPLIKFIFSKELLFYWSFIILLAFLSILIIKFFLQKNTKSDTPVFMTLLLGLLIYASIIGRSGHYFLITPFIFLSGAYFISSLNFFKSRKQKTVNGLYIFLLCLFCLYGIRHLAIFRYNIFSGLAMTSENNTVDRIGPIKISPVQGEEIKSLQAFFYKNSENSDAVYILNNDPGLYFLLYRKNPTPYDLPLLEGTLDKRLHIVALLKKNPPKFVIEDTKAWPVDGVSDKQRMPEVFSFVATNYKLLTTVGQYKIYVPRSIP